MKDENPTFLAYIRTIKDLEENAEPNHLRRYTDCINKIPDHDCKVFLNALKQKTNKLSEDCLRNYEVKWPAREGPGFVKNPEELTFNEQYLTELGTNVCNSLQHHIDKAAIRRKEINSNSLLW